VGYLVADLLEFGVGGVGVVFEEVGAAWGLLVGQGEYCGLASLPWEMK
jgi:hypothetical protein